MVLLGAAVSSGAHAQVFQRSESKEILETVSGDSFRDLGHGIYWETPVTKSNTRYLRAVFDQIVSPAGLEYKLLVLNDGGLAVGEYRSEKFASEKEFVTTLLPAGKLRFQISAQAPPTGLSFRFAKLVWQANDAAVPQDILPRWVSVRDLAGTEPARIAAASTALLHIGPLDVSCSGFLVTASNVITNYHCIEYSLSFLQSEREARKLCRDVIIEFDHLVKDQVGRQAHCLEVEVADPEVDYAILVVDPEEIRTDAGTRPPLQLRRADLPLPRLVNVLHYPVGLPAMLDEACHVFATEYRTLLEHDCGTFRGSSGAPVLDEDMHVVALHFGGAYPDDWTQEMIVEAAKNNVLRRNRARALNDIVAGLH